MYVELRSPLCFGSIFGRSPIARTENDDDVSLDEYALHEVVVTIFGIHDITRYTNLIFPRTFPIRTEAVPVGLVIMGGVCQDTMAEPAAETTAITLTGCISASSVRVPFPV